MVYNQIIHGYIKKNEYKYHNLCFEITLLALNGDSSGMQIADAGHG